MVTEASPEVIAILEQLIDRIDLKELLFQIGLQVYADEFYGMSNVRLLVIKEIEYTGPERQLTDGKHARTTAQ